MSKFDCGHKVRFYDHEGYFQGEIVRVEPSGCYPYVDVDFDNWVERFVPNDLTRSCSELFDLRTKQFEEFWAVQRRGMVTESYLAEQC